MPLYHKINARVADPVTGKRLRRGAKGRGPVSHVSFGAFLLTAFVGWRAFQVLSRSVWRRRGGRRDAAGGEGQLVEWNSDEEEEEEEEQLPPLVRGGRGS